ncbi:MAG: YHYH protein [Gammaproteobacteria bacterium]
MNSKKAKLICGAVFCVVLTPLILLACSGGTVLRSSDAASTLSPREHCEAVIASVVDAGFTDEAEVTCDDEYAYIHSDSYASHEMMTGIVGTNEQIPVPAHGYFAPIRSNPVLTTEPKTRDSSLAIAINGIPIFDYSAGGEMSIDDLYVHQPHLDTLLRGELDICGGHTGRGDDYHYHELPRCMIEQMDNAGDDAIIAWGFDGFPLYGNNNPDGSVIAAGVLDVCNGQLDPVFGYRYHTSDEPPYILQCLLGEIADLSSVPTIGIGRPSGRPVAVENLTFVHDDIGTGVLTYDYEGDAYYIKSTPTGTENCFDFEWRTITNGGIIESGEYCHIVRTDGGMGGGGMGMGGGGMGAP